MNEFIEKLIGRLEEYKDSHLIEHDSEECLHCQENDWCNCRDCSICVWDKAVEIVNQIAEEYNNGWIPVSERLPDKSGWFLCTQEYHSLTNRKLIKVTTELVEFYDNKWRRTKNLVVTHWQPLPEPYQPKGEKG